MNGLPPDPQRLRAILAHLDQQVAENATVGTYLRLQRATVQRALAAADNRSTSPRGRPTKQTSRPPATGYRIEPKLGPQHPRPPIVHTAACAVAQREPKPICAQDARTALKDDVIAAEACEFCKPNSGLGLAG
ncbi:DUF6233 domain-containing protein [Streptomyces cavernae]|uniref:DUF6233 domain-containing protein n=1 Tax=Streptomyces cavernae TaxID=2259034 RepID=UPI000FEBE148|nr:DUF6233 domain-containing protein [Streptomyces cavernae]